MNPYDHVRDTFTGGCRFGMRTGLGFDADGTVVPVALPLRTEFEARWARFERMEREACQRKTAPQKVKVRS